MRSFLKEQRISGRTDAESLERNSKSSIHLVLATSSEYPGKERTIVGKHKSRFSSAKSLRSKI